MVFQECLKERSRKIESFKGVSGEFQRSSMGVSRYCSGHFKEVSMVFHGSIKAG